MARKSVLSSQISIPIYWKDYVNSKVDIENEPKQPCPFHNEVHGKSFSYSPERGYFSCFGACHVLGGDVVQMHMLNYKIRNYDDAEKSLARLYGIKLDKTKMRPTFQKPNLDISDADVEWRVAYGEACHYAKTVDDWIELDYIMSQYPVKIDTLRRFVERRK